MSQDWFKRVSRRRFLQDAAGFTLALPFLPSIMAPVNAFGQTAPRKRLISFFTSNGQRRVNLYPSANAALPWRVLDADNHVREFTLRDLPGGLSSAGVGLSPIFGPQFNPLRDKMNIVRGLDCIGNWTNHVGWTMLSSSSSLATATIDQILSQSSKVYEARPRIPLLHPYITNDAYPNSVGPVALDAQGLKIPGIHSPAILFDRVFGTQMAAPMQTVNERRFRRQRVIDRVLTEFNALRSHPRLGSEDKGRLEDHAQKLQDLQARLEANSSMSSMNCTGGSRPPYPEDTPTQMNFRQYVEAMLDIVVLALKCDITRVVTIPFSRPTDTFALNFFDGGLLRTDHHSISHSASHNGTAASERIIAEGQLASINRWYADRILYFLNQMNQIESGTSTYLDNSLVLWGNEDGSADHDVHMPYSMPTVMFGGLAGTFKTGRYFDYRRHGLVTPGGSGFEPWHGRPYNQFILSILDGFGLVPAEYEKPNQAGYGTYTGSTGRSENNSMYNQYIDSDAKRRALLPFFKAS